MKALLHMAATALTANRDTQEAAGLDPYAKFTVYASEIMYAGGIAAVDYTDEVQMAADTAGLRVAGRVKEYVDNTVDGHSAEVENGLFWFTNSSTYTIPRSAIGEVCFVEDDNIVASFSTNLVPAGIIRDVDSTKGVLVDMTPEGLALARKLAPALRVSKTADYTVTAAICFQGQTWYDVDDTETTTITLPSAVGGYRVGVRRKSATAAHDVEVQCATGDKIQGGDAMSAASKKVDNTTDAVTDIIWWRAADDTHWIIDNPPSAFPANWPKNDA